MTPWMEFMCICMYWRVLKRLPHTGHECASSRAACTLRMCCLRLLLLL